MITIKEELTMSFMTKLYLEIAIIEIVSLLVTMGYAFLLQWYVRKED